MNCSNHCSRDKQLISTCPFESNCSTRNKKERNLFKGFKFIHLKEYSNIDCSI